MTIKEQILVFLKENHEMSVKEITDRLMVSKQAVHYAINQLLSENQIEKFGRTPKTIYKLAIPELSKAVIDWNIDPKTIDYLERNFLIITELGKMITGIDGFIHWCGQRDLPVEKTLNEYLLTKKKYEGYYNRSGMIDGKDKLINTKGFRSINLDSIYYLDFYAIERFGKTRLGTLLHFAKQGQNKFLMKLMMEEVQPRILAFIHEKQFDAIGYVPPTIRREVQIMKFIEGFMKINLPKVAIKKISGIIPVPQKSLHKIDERINNADNTFTITETNCYTNLLLLDDAVGSGSTMNQIAGKIKNKGVAKQITGLALVGSFKGFDVITDV